MTSTHKPLWQPTSEHIQRSQMAQFLALAQTRFDLDLPDYQALWQWSIDDARFWALLWEFVEIKASTPASVVKQTHAVFHKTQWFPDAKLNYAENLLRNPDQRDAIVFMGENGEQRQLSRHALYQHVSLCVQGLEQLNIKQGDRVAAWMPNIPETIVLMLACASIGAIFSSASPDFGVDGVVDRFSQIAPTLLVTVDGYYYNGKLCSVVDKLAATVARLPSLQHTMVCNWQGTLASNDRQRYLDWHACLAAGVATKTIKFKQLPFDQPLYILFSSGTTGTPKCITHSAGAALLQHLKEQRLHTDVRDGDRVFFFTTCGWMMWNWLASILASEACVLLFDGAPLYRQGAHLLNFIDQTRCSHFGVSAKFIDGLAKSGSKPRADYDFSALRTILSTGSPLNEASYDFIYNDFKHDVCLSSISGGTDILSCFVLGNPMIPVYRGEIQCAALGMDVAVFDQHGEVVPLGTQGELVCRQPFPSTPLCFWQDENDTRLLAAYFNRYPNVWHHGDYCAQTEHRGYVIYGRSDATLNPNGVRIGTAEIYRRVEHFATIVDAVVVGQSWHGDERVVLFVVLKENAALTDALAAEIRADIKQHASPRHVPAKIIQVTDIPRTRSGKTVEIAVKNVIHGRRIDNIEALANPEALALFANLSALQA